MQSRVLKKKKKSTLREKKIIITWEKNNKSYLVGLEQLIYRLHSLKELFLQKCHLNTPAPIAAYGRNKINPHTRRYKDIKIKNTSLQFT